MKNTKSFRKCLIFISLLLVFATALNAVGCSADKQTDESYSLKIQSENPSVSIPQNEVSVPGAESSSDDGITTDGKNTPIEAGKPDNVSKPDTEISQKTFGSKDAAVTDFALRLFRASGKSGENTLISPLSVICALAMTANGAEGETLKQMENVLGMKVGELNYYLYEYIQNLPKGDNCRLSLADSIWFNEGRITVNREFLKAAADYYGADIFNVAFEEQTCKDINSWVKENTDGMIKDILENIDSDEVMYLINALAFDAEWEHKYDEFSVSKGTFIKEDGTEQKAEFMHGRENIYLNDKNATGFMKYYTGRKYAFVAMLPNEGISVSDYIASLDGESLNALLKNPDRTTVETAVPKFETAFDIEMSGILSQMGMPRAFDRALAEFGGLGTSEGNLFIGRILHKTCISVFESGTKASAATVVGVTAESCPNKSVYLDRPFVYMLIDCEKNIPFFIGTMNDIEK